MNKKTLSAKYLSDCMAILALMVCAAVLFIKCRYGIGNIDETFYLSVPLRLLKGDSLFVNEWHLSQMSGVLSCLPVSAFVRLTGGTEGIILACRWMAVILQGALSMVFYFRMRRFGKTAAFLSAFVFGMYVPYSIAAFSYNSMGVWLLSFAALLLLPARKGRYALTALSAICFAGSVLCCPYLISVYFLYAAAAVLCRAMKKTMPEDDNPLNMRVFLTFTACAAVCAAAFLAFVLSRASLMDIISCIGHMLNDPEHSGDSFFMKMADFARSPMAAGWLSGVCFAFLLIGFLVCLFDKKRKARRCRYFLFAVLCTGILLITHISYRKHVNIVMLPVSLMAPYLFLLTGNKEIRRLFYLFWLPGVLYAMCLNLTSNQYVYAVSGGLSVSAMGTTAMIVMFTRELLKDGTEIRFSRAVLPAVCLLMALQMGTEAYLRVSTVFWEPGGLKEQTVYVNNGIQKGLYVSPVRAEEYENALKVVDKAKAYGVEKVLFLSENTWLTVLHGGEHVSYSAWLSGVNEHTVKRLEAYYNINPEKKPDLVYAEAENKVYAQQLAEYLAYETHLTEEGVFLLAR